MDNTVPPKVIQPTPVPPTTATPVSVPSSAVPPAVPSTTAPQVPPVVVPPPTPAPEDSGSKNGLKTFLIEAGIIMVLVVILLFVLNYFKIVNLASFFPNQFFPTAKQETKVSNISITPAQIKANNPIINSDIIQRYQEVTTNSALITSTQRVVYEGKISELDASGSFNKRLNMKYQVVFGIRGKGEIVNVVFLSKEDLQKIKIVRKSGDQESPTTLSSLKVGDSIILDYTINQLSPIYDNIISGKLTKL